MNHNSKPVPHSTESPAHRVAIGSRRILLVEQDPTLSGSLTDRLAAAGYFVIPAADGQEALAFAGRLPVDLALLDMEALAGKGRKTFQQFTRRHPHTPVIVTAARPNDFPERLNGNPSVLVGKPLRLLKLLRTIAELLPESPEQRLSNLAAKN